MRTVIITLLTVSGLLAQAPTIGNTAPSSSGAGGTCASLGGDATGTCAANTVVKINNGSVPASATILGTNSSSQPVAATTTGTGTTAVLSVSPAFTGTPTAPTPASTDKTTTLATTAFAQGLIASLNQAVAVNAATTTILASTPTYNNGTAGVGATLTAGSNGAFPALDGYTASLNDRILVNNQASSLQNGVYSLTTLGNGGAPYVLTRATDFNTAAFINGSGAIPVLNGTVNNNTLWVLSNTIAAIGTGQNNINYSLGATTAFPVLTITNATSTGTTLNKLVKLTGAPSTAVIAATTDTSGVIGLCSAGCGTTGAATVSEQGFAGCIFDGATTAGDYVQISPTTAGDCHDSGSAFPTSGEVVGRVMTTNAGGGTFSVLLFSPDVVIKQNQSAVQTVGLVIDGGGSVPATGFKGIIQVPYGATITGWTMIADQSCSAQITVSKGTYAAYPSVSSIVASAPPVLSSAQKNTTTTLSGWTTSITAGDIISFNLDSVATCTRIMFQMQVTRT